MKLDWAARAIPELAELDEAAVDKLLRDAYRRIPWYVRLLFRPLNAYLAAAGAAVGAFVVPIVSAAVDKVGLLGRAALFFVGGGAGAGVGTWIKRRVFLAIMRPYVRRRIREMRPAPPE
ncbi:MAG: hypothetical protein ACYS9X_27790 [Planctomycetota bacterium]|jgi:hypothetical protein